MAIHEITNFGEEKVHCIGECAKSIKKGNIDNFLYSTLYTFKVRTIGWNDYMSFDNLGKLKTMTLLGRKDWQACASVPGLPFQILVTKNFRAINFQYKHSIGLVFILCFFIWKKTSYFSPEN